MNLSARRGPCRLGRGRSPAADEFRPGRESVLVTVVGLHSILPRHETPTEDTMTSTPNDPTTALPGRPPVVTQAE